MSEKRKSITNYNKKIAEFQLAKNNFKKPIKTKTDFNNIKIYYFTFWEIFWRMTIIFSQICFAIGIMINGFLFSRYLVNLINNYGDVKISQIVLRVFFYFFSIIPMLLILFFLLPIIICNRIGSLKSWSITFIIWGTIIYLFAIGDSILNYLLLLPNKDSFGLNNKIMLLPAFLFSISLILTFFSSLFIIGIVDRKINIAKKVLKENLELNRIKIN